MRRALMFLLLLTSCVTEDAGVAAARMEAQDDASCRSLVAGKGADTYQQCRQNLIGYRQQAAADQAARTQARALALQQFGEAMQATGDAMRSASPSRNNNDTIHFTPDHIGGTTCTS